MMDSTKTQAAINCTPIVRRNRWLSSIRRVSANFWLEFLFWWTEHAPSVVWRLRGLFLPLAWRFGATMRNDTLANARGVLGASTDEASCTMLAKNIIRSFYVAVYEMGCALRVPLADLKKRVDSIEGRQLYLDARQSHRGAVIVTAHLGSFELGAAALLDYESRIHVVFRRDVSQRFDRLRSKLRERLGILEAPVDDGWSTWTRLREALESDEVVLIQGDRVMPGQKGLAVPFLGKQLLIPTGPFKLALAAASPIIPVFSFRTTVGRLRVVIDEPIVVSREDGPFDARHPAVLRLTRVIERHVREYPEQWLMVERLWFGDGNLDAGTKSING